MTETTSLLERARAHMTPNYTPPPFIVSHGKGSRLWDTEGREYLDFAGGIGVTALGHGHPAIVRAIADQAAKVCHTSNLFYHENYIRVCTLLSELSFGERVFLSNSGAEAVEAALKLARRFFHQRGEPRAHFVAMKNSFHGRTYGALSVTGQLELQDGFAPLLPDVSYVPFADLEALAAALAPTTAAVIVEPILGNGGIVVPPPGYLAGVRQLCDKSGCLLIFDEVQTGIGRTGRWFAHEHEEVTPDIMTLAKMLGGGLPLGAMVTTAEIASALQPGSHASTYGGNPVACAASLATLETIAGEQLLERATQAGVLLRQLLDKVAAKHSSALEVRGRGLMNGLVMDRPALPLKQACLTVGLLTSLAGGRVLRLMPPLNVSDQEIDEAATLIDEALQRCA